MKLLFILFLINISIMKSQDIEKKIYFGGGCFWCIEAFFENVNGVKSVISGYSGGNKKKPTYQEVITGKTNHAEVCEITYNAKIINLKSLLEIFFVAHDPTTLNRQGNDVGTQYRSIIFYNDEKEKIKIVNFISEIQESIFENQKIVTQIEKAKEFYIAEEYHQNFYQLNTDYPYCKMVITPKIQELRKKLKKYYK